MMFSVVVCLLLVSVALGARADEEITYLPGWSPKSLPSKQYSGFVDSNSEGTLKMHYWFIESEADPATAPLLLWFNGGPGASSLYGLLLELGPFMLSDLSYRGERYAKTNIPQLIYNPSGWQKSANILALSMPPPVGFSFCTPPGVSATGNDCGSWNDTSTAQVTYHALKSFFIKYPEYLKNEMYIAGESYAGVYVPMLVKEVLADADTNGMNLKGFAVGDACTPPELCGSKKVGPYWSIEFLYGHGAFSNKLYEEIQQGCSQDELAHGDLSEGCSALTSQVAGEAGPYWVYAYYDDCTYQNDIRRQRHLQSFEALGYDMGAAEAIDARPYYGPPLATSSRRIATVDGTDASQPATVLPIPNGYACGAPAAQREWLSLDVVKDALHVGVDAEFFQCDNGGDFTYELTESDLISWYKEIIANNTLRIMVYNGDTDPGIMASQAQNWTRNLGFAEVESWRAWTLDECQRVGGYVTEYENQFTFLTIRGAGHMVPQMKPEASLEFITAWMQGGGFKNYDTACTNPQVRQYPGGPAPMTPQPVIDLTVAEVLDQERAQWLKREAELVAMLEQEQV